MDEAINWIELIDRYFEWQQNDARTIEERPFDPWKIQSIAPPEALAYYIQKILEIHHNDPRDLIDFVPENSLTQIAETVIRLLEMKTVHGEFASTIERISLQHPETLHPYLDRLFDLILDRDDIYHTFRQYVRGAWRKATQLDRYFTILRDAEQPYETRSSAWECLMETRNLTVMREALAEVESGRFTPNYYSLKNYIMNLGFEWDGSELRQLYRDEAYHMIFPDDYIGMHTYKVTLLHPTYLFDITNAIRLPFGGLTDHRCWRCKQPLHHIITTTPELNQLPIHSRKNVEFVTCLTCMFENLYYQHDESGKATSIPYGKPLFIFTGRIIPRNPHPLLINAIGAGRGKRGWRGRRRKLLGRKYPGFMERKVALVPTPKRWQWQPDMYENMHRLGGYPVWVQTADYPRCPHCEKQMIFVMQIKDQLPLADGSEQDWGDTGIGYFYWCDDCAISGFISQST